MADKVIGLTPLIADLQTMHKLQQDPKLITRPLARAMTSCVHVDSGYLRSTIYYQNNVAGARAPYAGTEEERGGSHAYATRAIDSFNEGKYLDIIVEPF